MKLLAAHYGAPVRTSAVCSQVEAARADETVLRRRCKLARAGPGGLIVIPPNVVHYIEVVGDRVALELDVFTPKRPEYGG